MAAEKRTAAQRSIDLVLVEELHIKGHTQGEIADYLNNQRPYQLSRQQIGYDLRKLAKMWRAEAIDLIANTKNKALAELRVLQREYWDAWEHSLEVIHVTDEGELRTMSRKGDPRFLDGVGRCFDRRVKLLGLDAPNTMASPNVGISLEDYVKEHNKRWEESFGSKDALEITDS